MDKAVHNALIKIRHYEEEIHRLNQFITQYEELSGTKVKRDELLSKPDMNHFSETTPSSGKRKNDPGRIARVAEDIIREAQKPLTRGTLLARVLERGVTIHSKDKAKYLGTILWRQSDKFENIEGRGYWFIDLLDPAPGPELAFLDEMLK